MDFERSILSKALMKADPVENGKISKELLCVSNRLSDQEAATGHMIDEFNYSEPLSAETIAFYQTVKHSDLSF